MYGEDEDAGQRTRAWDQVRRALREACPLPESYTAARGRPRRRPQDRTTTRRLPRQAPHAPPQYNTTHARRSRSRLRRRPCPRTLRSLSLPAALYLCCVFIYLSTYVSCPHLPLHLIHTGVRAVSASWFLHVSSCLPPVFITCCFPYLHRRIETWVDPFCQWK
ncbi:hypothetical protein B0H17DRAFT_72046 [Mycena rosella]|uniref:Uncharacterized protein n=1 Tax=Mycena rosella TaxID=1033263 RepID=A0AAD7D6C6_MYCRO|nr:hypothetical protein B0H17DRAFT_72046 [Mycena rosella]